jgi:[pyruvate, water dikinase]-phosphate phosphotransferase / [pyruvate, water dikinase] kinase
MIVFLGSSFYHGFMRDVYIHLVSDATGATLQGLAQAGLAQFERINPIERLWPLVRTKRQMERVTKDIEDHKGVVLYTLVDSAMCEILHSFCEQHDVPCIDVMDPIISGLATYLGQPSQNVAGLQHKMDDSYFKRIDAIDFAMGFDDGQNLTGIETADVILVGVSRTSKTPTCIYLAQQGVRAANIPLVPSVPFPAYILSLKTPLFVGLTESADRLIELRASRMKIDQKQQTLFGNHYIHPEHVEEEVQSARKFFREQSWPIIDVTKKSVEETAAEILVLLQRKRSDTETI